MESEVWLQPCNQSTDIETTQQELTQSRANQKRPIFCQAVLNLDGQQSPQDDGYIALGAIRLVKTSTFDDHAEWLMIGANVQTLYPCTHLLLGMRREWLKIEVLPHLEDANHAIVRIYAVPEDVNRSSRGSIKDFRKVLRGLIDYIDTSHDTWKSCHLPHTPLRTYQTSQAAEEESLFYIFNTLSSPQPSIDNLSSAPYAQQSMIDVLQDDVAGLKTNLYPYQKRSIAAMIEKESSSTKSIDPRKPCFTDLCGRKFYFDVIDGILLLEPHLYSEPQGGILAETMGYGKTLICLALILSTRGQYPKVPEGRLDLSRDDLNPRTPSLVELAAKALKRSGTPWKAQLADLEKRGYHFDECREAINKWDAEFAEPIFHPTTPNRKASQRESFSILRLSYTTLVIVPPNLLVQWQHEIEKHTEEGALDVLVLDSNAKTIPHFKTLMEHDIVLITKARFEQEYRDDDLNQGRRAMGSARFRSQLTEVRWLRVICDEGHSFAGANYRTNAMAMLDKLSVERRWVVSGTPSNSLHGVEINLAINETRHETTKSRKESIKSALEGRKSKDSNNDEVKDMERLRVMVVKFLKLQPWANQKGVDFADWKKYLAPFDASGNRRFAPGLKTVLQSLIIRHRIEDIDIDLALPPLHNRTVFLEPSYYDKLSMNLFRLVLASNAVTSERTDEDYMFHPKNRKSLDELITNLRHSSFHWVGFSKHDITETIRVSNTYFDNNIDKISDSDGALLTEAILNGKRALDDRGWCAFSFFHEIGVYVNNFPEHAAQAWALHGEDSRPLLLGTVQAREAQQYIFKHLDSYDPASGLIGAGMRAMNSARDRAQEELNARQKTSTNAPGKSPTAGSGDQPKVKNQTTTSSAPLSSPVRLKDSARAEPMNDLKRPFPHARQPLPKTLQTTSIIGFTSAKLNYLCSRIVSLHREEKIIIFYDSNNIAFWIAEALELLSVKFLIYANTLSVSRRAAYLATFNHSDVFRVLLMDLKQASHGLHVACASRVFIVSPIWQPSIESQAIKRAHRIGQTRPVFVETLVLKGTLEEKILQRRRQMSNAEHVKAEKSLLDDRTMNEMIREEGFLKINDNEKSHLTGGKLDVPVPLFDNRHGNDTDDHDHVDYGDKQLNTTMSPFPDKNSTRIDIRRRENDVITDMEDEHVTKRARLLPNPPGLQSQLQLQPEHKSAAVSFDVQADSLQDIDPNSTAHAPSLFGRPATADQERPKKSVRIVVQEPP